MLFRTGTIARRWQALHRPNRYLAKFQITQEDIETEVAANRRAQKEAEAKAQAAEQAARNVDNSRAE